MKSKISLAALLLFSTTILAVDPGHPIPPAPGKPGIFGVGFTNNTDTSARVVFTTSEPTSATIVVTANGKELSRVDQPAFDEIHSADLANLPKGEVCSIAISGVTKDGKTVAAENQTLKPALRAPSSHQWPGYTIFASTINSKGDEGLNLMAQTGARMARMEISWYDLFPKGPDIDQVYLDHFLSRVAELKKRNIEPLLVLCYCVPWAKAYTATTMTWRHPSFGPPDSLEDWEHYVRTAVTALHGSVKYYEIWNEPDAGYLATGNYIERPNLPPPIGRPPFKDNWQYWLGDRFVPMIERVRKIMDELQPDAIVMNGGWNRDYTGQRGDLLFERGVAPYFDVYAFHTYCSNPMSFSRWYGAIDGGFRKNIDRIFDKHKVRMPLAVTEWGWPVWDQPNPEKGFVTFPDAQKFYIKSSFYFLSMQRMELLSQFSLGIGPHARDIDPAMFALASEDTDGKAVTEPTFMTFQWLATTFGSRKYRALPVQAIPDTQVKAYAIQMQDTGDTYLAVWQDGVPDAKGAIPPQPAQDVEVTVSDVKDGNYSLQNLDLVGNPTSQSQAAANHSLKLKLTLPEISSTEESGISLVKISGIKAQ